ncbi:hypothetical protein QR680_002588 [Steinernema hermaphroditum]|uniref:Uncharacterized protein n=1 Tax=Steinernema hermaphroditum TaxID=289476 RepID=A0AA39LIJ7_9BILA|nr:hypothetical protein QR680_002588 [Steinernema hermaphroditum]
MSRVLKRFVEAVDDIESPFFDRAISLAEEATGYRRAALDAHELHAFFLGGHWDTNDEVKKVDQPLPKKVFKKIALEQNQLEELRLPVKFYKGHGLVMNIIFDERDSIIKRCKSESVMELIDAAKKEVTLEGDCNALLLVLF